MNRSRFLLLLLLLLGTAYAAAGLSRIGFNVEILELLPRGLSQVKGLSLYLNNFARPDELIVTVSSVSAAATDEAVRSLSRSLAGHPDLVGEVLARPPWENAPSDLSEMAAYLLVNAPPATVRSIIERLSPRQAPAAARASLEEIASTPSVRDMLLLGQDPYRIVSGFSESDLPEGAAGGGFSSPDGTFRVIYLTSAKRITNYRETAAWVEKIRGLCSGTPIGQGVKISFTGEPAFVAEISTSMQRDMICSALGTLIFIGLLFWGRYRQMAPLVWLLLLLQLVFLLSLATAGFLLHRLTAVGAGFASVMIGLSVDYGFFIHHRAQHHTGNVTDLRRDCFRNIFWTSGTTAAAFFALNFSSFPGLSQFGNMVGIGVCIGVAVMLGIFAPLSLRFRKPDSPALLSGQGGLTPSLLRIGEAVVMAMVFLLLSVLAAKGFPRCDFSPSTLRPENIPAQRALNELSARLGGGGEEPIHLIVTGNDSGEVLLRLGKLRERLEEAERRGELHGSFVPLQFWPSPANRVENLTVLKGLIPHLPRLRDTLLSNGFDAQAFALTKSVFERIGAWSAEDPVSFPDNPSGRWISERILRPDGSTPLALGFVQPVQGHEQDLVRALAAPGVYPVNWETLGGELGQTLPREILLVSLALIAGILSILALGLRSFRAIILFVLTTSLFLTSLAGAMSLLGMKWGFFNLAAIILLLGTGTDYGILLLLSLHRNGGDIPAARRELGMVILLCAASAAAGFGSLAWAANPGLASLGKTCALGLVIDALISFFLLPVGWRVLFGGRVKTGSV